MAKLYLSQGSLSLLSIDWRDAGLCVAGYLVGDWTFERREWEKDM